MKLIMIGLLGMWPLLLAAQQKMALSVELSANDGLFLLQKSISPPVNVREKVMMQGSTDGAGLSL